MTDPTLPAWSRENDLLFQLRRLREENEQLREDHQGVDAVDTLTEEGWTWDGDQWQRPAQPAVINMENFVGSGKPVVLPSQPVLQDIEQYRMQMAGISTAALGYWKEGDGIHPDYNTVALRDVAKLYAKYDALYKAQPEQEPVAWEQFYPDIGKPQLKQEPVAIYRAGQAKGEGFHVEFFKAIGADEVLLYTTPPKRPWVGLTDEEISQLWISTSPYFNEDDFAKAVGAKLKEKNT